MEFKDQLQRTLNLSQTPSRIVSLVPSQTELLVALGLHENLVGITKFCVHPKKLRKEKTVVGGTKTVHYDKIEQLNPDIIICNKEENTPEMVEQLSSIAPVWVSGVNSIEQSIIMIGSLGEIFKVTDRAFEIISEINLAKHNFLKFMEGKKYKKVIYLIWKNPYMAAGKDTFINSLLTLNHFENTVFDVDSRYPEISLEKISEAELILLSTEPFPFKLENAKKLSDKINKEVKLVDGEYFSWYGSRLKDAFAYFKTLH